MKEKDPIVTARFYRKACGVADLTAGKGSSYPFVIEQVVLLSEAEFSRYKETGLLTDKAFISESSSLQHFDPGDECWHCLLVKGEHSRDGLLVCSEGYNYARYAAYVGDCSRLILPEQPPDRRYLRPRQQER
ncbi:MAG: DUF6329 domain-containing protein [Gemmiger sp.]|uniref:DUF6329 domain-containing protein n=1 Tax=Gemmiger sp. TaxID=2049027 RepID=UPI002A91118F|nr:DUF6329 domain-containing protein [Gemmiger sp.]MDY5326679.1 DUF6329 domain-containing protein [Gemmiger sp.]